MCLRRGWNDPFRTDACDQLQDAADSRLRDTVCSGDLGERHAAGAITHDGEVVDIEWAAADVTTFEFGSAHAGPHSFDNQIPLQLGDGADNDDDGAAKRAARIDALSENSMLRLLSSSSTSRK